MNAFEKVLTERKVNGLNSIDINTIQVNLGLKCNQQCRHCHVSASPNRTEMLPWPTMELILDALGGFNFQLMDLTGGAPELNPHFKRFVTELRRRGHSVQVRTNLTVLLESGMDLMMEFFRDHEIQLVASLPCYREENVRKQRGAKVYQRSLDAIRQLNALGYGTDTALPLQLVYNPEGAFLPPQQAVLEDQYRHELDRNFGITFTRLLTITNMPVGRFRLELQRQNREHDYLRLLRESFNFATVDGLMCRHQISVGWDGKLYDCDFNMALGLPINHGAPDHITSFDMKMLKSRKIVTGEHCFGCTAGCGSSCRGALL